MFSEVECEGCLLVFLRPGSNPLVYRKSGWVGYAGHTVGIC